jgi:uncharacterized membrane protein
MLIITTTIASVVGFALVFIYLIIILVKRNKKDSLKNINSKWEP